MKIFNRKTPDDADIERDGIEGERSVTSVNKGLGTQTRITNIVITTAVIGLVLFLLFNYYSALYQKSKAAKEAGKADASKNIVTNLPPLKPLALAPDQVPAAPPSPVAQLTPNATAQGANGQVRLTPAQEAEQRRLKSGIFFKVQASSGAVASGGQAGPAYSNAGNTSSGSSSVSSDADSNSSDPLSKSLQPSKQAGARAYMLANPSMMITKGAVIPCTVVPAIDSTLPGIVTCIQSADVWSTDRKVLLLERGTKWVGEQKLGLSQGQKRLAMLWTRGETQNHVLVDIDSGTADSLGRAGIAGETDTHFWDRFGGAILISLVGDVGSYLAATQSGGAGNNTAIAFPGTVNGAQSAMSDILKSTLTIPPTLTKNQGAAISIYVARDLDFSDVYALQARQ